MKHVGTQTPTLIPFQAFRALLWTAFALPVIGMLRHRPWLGALVTGLFLSLPMNVGLARFVAPPIIFQQELRRALNVWDLSLTVIDVTQRRRLLKAEWARDRNWAIIQ